MNGFTKQLLAKGYQLGHNDGEVIPAGPGVPCFPAGHRVKVTDDRIRVYTGKLFGEAYTKRSWWDQVTVAVFDSVESYLGACPTKSEGGIGPNEETNVWD